MVSAVYNAMPFRSLHESSDLSVLIVGIEKKLGGAEESTPPNGVRLLPEETLARSSRQLQPPATGLPFASIVT